MSKWLARLKNYGDTGCRHSQNPQKAEKKPDRPEASTHNPPKSPFEPFGGACIRHLQEKNVGEKLAEASKTLHINPDEALQLYRDDLDVIADMPVDTVKAFLQDAIDNGRLSREPPQDNKVVYISDHASTAALRLLRRLYQQHRGRLEDGGYSGDGARVTVIHWQDECHKQGITRNQFNALVGKLVDDQKIRIEHGYVYPF